MMSTPFTSTHYQANPYQVTLQTAATSTDRHIVIYIYIYRHWFHTKSIFPIALKVFLFGQKASPESPPNEGCQDTGIPLQTTHRHSIKYTTNNRVLLSCTVADIPTSHTDCQWLMSHQLYRGRGSNQLYNV